MWHLHEEPCSAWPRLAMMRGNIQRKAGRASWRKEDLKFCLRPRRCFGLQFMTPSWQGPRCTLSKRISSILLASLHPDCKVYTQTYTHFSGASNLQPLLPIPLPMARHVGPTECCLQWVCHGCTCAASNRGMLDCPFCRAPNEVDSLVMVQKRADAKDPVAVEWLANLFLRKLQAILYTGAFFSYLSGPVNDTPAY